MRLTTEQENALLKATLREILRIAVGAEVDSTCVAIEDALNGRLKREWIDIRAKAKHLLTSSG